MKIIKLAMVVIIFALTNCNQSSLWDNLNSSESDLNKVGVAPTVETLVPTAGNTFLPLKSIVGTSFEAGGEVPDPGSSPIVEMGVCISEDYTNYDNCLPAETISGNMFKVLFTGLVPGKDYYIKAYADNGFELSHGLAIGINSGYEIGTNIDGGIVFQNDGAGSGLLAHENNPTIIVQRNWVDAVSYCENLTSNGSSEWNLPSRKLLFLIHERLAVSGMSSFSGICWSSDEEIDNTPTRSYSVYFSNGHVGLSYKSNLHYVIPIRRF